ncbi:OLC1v1008187C2 [Oldenlandia corymbosa var. corymbosa]|nr:OLC1v1008187C2 [Oldenlandia corymbosa var. corymbosa]
MGKKGSWFSAIKKVFSPSSKEKPSDGLEKKSSKEKKKGRSKSRYGENRPFIPLFREPSSIEQILGEADQLFIRQTMPSERPITPSTLPVRPASPRVTSPKVPSPRAISPTVTSPKIASPRAASQRVASPQIPPPRSASPQIPPPRTVSPQIPPARVASPRAASPVVSQNRKPAAKYVQRPEPTLQNLHLSATKIQAAYRGYMARRSFRALRGLVRLQGVVRGQNVKRQTMNAMKQMQLLVRVQTQIQSRRIQMLESQALQRANKNDKEAESTLSKWNQSEAGENWDDSVLTKEEVEGRLRKKVEAVIKRERAMAYAYSHQLWKANPRSSQPVDIRSNGYPWWWNWLERQLPPTNPSENQSAVKNVQLTPPRPTSDYKRSPRPVANNYRHHNYAFDNHESVTPRSSKSAAPVRGKQFHTPSRTPPPSSSGMMKYSTPRASAARSPFDVPMNDTDSLTSCPPFSVPNYMTPTVSAKAKVRANSNPKERVPGTPGNDSKRRFSFPLTPNIGSFKWNKGSNKDSAAQKALEKHESMRSIGDVSVESTVSMPAIVGRKPFNRFV